mgnify:FL=1
MKIKAATFDIGGVLYSDDVFKRAIHKALNSLGAKVSDEDFEKVYQEHLKSQNGSLRSKLCLTFLGSLDRKAELLERTNDFWLFESSDAYSDGLPEIIKLKKAGIKVGLIANQPASIVDTLKRDGYFELLDFVGISAIVGLEKPALDFFKLAVEKLGYSAQEVVHIGNRIDNDVIPAKSIGMRTIWLRRGEANPNPTDSDLKEADLTIETLTGVAEQVFNL